MPTKPDVTQIGRPRGSTEQTQKRDKELRSAFIAGTAIAELCSRYGVSRQRVYQIAGEMMPLRRLTLRKDKTAKVKAKQAVPRLPPRLPPLEVARRLFEWRTRRNLTQTEAAQLLHCPQSTLGNWETGRKAPRHSTLLLAYMQALDLLDGLPDPKKPA